LLEIEERVAEDARLQAVRMNLFGLPVILAQEPLVGTPGVGGAADLDQDPSTVLPQDLDLEVCLQHL
jgi:hypothetical protein